MVKRKPAADEPFDIPQMLIKRVNLTLVGDTPLVVHRFSEKAKKEMLDKQMKKAKQAKAAKDPWVDYCDSMYWLTPKPEKPTEDDIGKARFGFPAIAFKAAAVSACSQVANITKVMARGAFHVEGDMVEIQGTPVMREDTVRIGMGTTDLRFRGEFKAWRVDLTVRYNANVLSAEQIANLFNIAGFAVGVGEGRPERDRDWGMFHVEMNGGK